MKTRGRSSAASQSVIIGGFAERPKPPSDLSPRQRAIWREVVDTEDPNFFNTAVLRGLLADYCRRRATAEGITKVIDGSAEVWAADDDSMAKYDALLKMRGREMDAMVRLATQLRLTNQARYVAHVAARAAAKAVKADEVPWAKRA